LDGRPGKAPEELTVVGARSHPEIEAHQVSPFMQRHGWLIIPVNPLLLGVRSRQQ
jgi:predicted CoA-binding protein